MIEKKEHSKKRLSKRTPVAVYIVAATLVFWFSVFFLNPSIVTAIELSDTPLESSVVGPPANVMLVLDNSGSMDWEFMTAEAEGLFQGNLYLFPENAYQPKPDHLYTSGPSLSPEQRRLWRSQWAGYNRIYFDPESVYAPWPDTTRHTFESAHLNRPWSNPMRRGDGHARINLAAEFFSIRSGADIVRIANAHYFTLGDANGNGVRDPDEAIYLVTWADDNRDGRIDLGGGAGQDRRQYYRFMDDGDERVEEGELVPVATRTEKNRIRPSIVNARGQFIRFQTDREALQNFANWYTYYRRRSFTLKAVTARILSELSQINVGICSVNNGPRIGVRPLRVQTGATMQDNAPLLLNALYAMQSNGLTPLRSALDRVGRYFGRQNRAGFDRPFNPDEAGGHCRRHMAVVVSDGFWNGAFDAVGNADGANGAPYADPYADTLADVAAHYYDNDLAPGVEDAVPPSGCTDASHQHMVTLALTFGVNGTIALMNEDGGNALSLRDLQDDPCLIHDNSVALQWPQPEALPGHEAPGGHAVSSAALLDDLFHATVNSRGRWYAMADAHHLKRDWIASQPQDPSKTVLSTTITLNGDRLRDSTVLYRTAFDSVQWTGEVTAWGQDDDGAPFGRLLWKASDHFQQLEMDANQRCVITRNGLNGSSPGVPFRHPQLSQDQLARLTRGFHPQTDQAQLAEDLIAYVRGADVPAFRRRTNLLGDIVHATPVVAGQTLFVGANDGMLHALDALSGRERFAYVPNQVYGHLKALSQPGYANHHRFYVDGPLWIGEVTVAAYQRRTYLVGALGKGGPGYFCLLAGERRRQSNGGGYGDYQWSFHVDQLDAPADEAQAVQVVQWEYPPLDPARDGMDNNGNGTVDESGEMDPDIGYAFGQGYAVNANCPDRSHRPVVIFGNGYNSPGQKAVLYVLDAASGEIVRKIDTGADSDNGLSTPALIDVNRDNRIDYAYAGDLNGNMWKFDLTAHDPRYWGVAYGEDYNSDHVIDAAAGDRPLPLFEARGQPITGRPDIMAMANACDPMAGGYMVIFGTGRYLTPDDPMDKGQQSIYGIWDYGDDADDEEHLGYLMDRSRGYLSSGLRLVRQTVTGESVKDDGIQRLISQAPVLYATQADLTDPEQRDDPMDHAGWFLDFPMAPDALAYPGERVTGRVILRSGRAVVTSLVPEQTLCNSGGSSWIYMLNGCGNSRPEGGDDYRATGTYHAGRILAPPVIVKNTTNPHLDRMVLPDLEGGILMEAVLGELWGQAYWWQNID